MLLEYRPQSGSDLPDSAFIMEEYKTLAEQSRFIMTRYMQALAIYIGVSGYAIREIATTPYSKAAITLGVGLSCLNIIAFYAANWFRSMAYHSLERQATLADELKFQRPHPMIWGYYLGVAAFSASQIGVVALVVSDIILR